MPFRRLIQGIGVFILMFILFIINSMFVEWQIMSIETRNNFLHNKSIEDRYTIKNKQMTILERIEEQERLNKQMIEQIKKLQEVINARN